MYSCHSTTLLFIVFEWTGIYPSLVFPTSTPQLASIGDCVHSHTSSHKTTAAEETETAVEETKTPVRKLSRTRTSIQLLLNTDAEVQKDVYLLTLAEVLAIRLYTGPAYVPINAFLREVAKVSRSRSRSGEGSEEAGRQAGEQAECTN